MEKLKFNKSSSVGSVVELMSPELMFTGVSGQPYRGTVYIQYVNNGAVLDTLSLKKYITDMRQEKILLEDVPYKFFADISNTIGTGDVNVYVDLTARGGIQSRTSYISFPFAAPEKKNLVFQI